MTRVLKVGIATREEIKERTLAIARGEIKPKRSDPKVWFTSVESLGQVLSNKNLLLLELISRTKPASMQELAKISGRAKSNLSRTLHLMERYGIVELHKGGGGRIKPEVPYDRINLDFPLTTEKEAA